MDVKSEDGELLARFINDQDRAAFDELMGRYHRGLYGFVWRFVGNHDDTDDICQLVFIQVFRKAESFRVGEKFKPWLYKIAVNQCKNFYRSVKNHDEFSDDSINHLSLDDADITVIDEIENEQIQGILSSAIEKLPPKQKTTLLLRVKQGYKFNEIAKILDCPLGTTKANFHHAIRALRVIYEV